MQRKKMVAVALLSTVAVVAVLIVYAFSQPIIGCLGCGGEPIPVVSGSIIVPAGSNAGTLAITIRNDVNVQITSITASVASQDSGVTVASGGSIYSAGGPGYTIYTGSLPNGQTASSTVQVTGVSTGNVYIFTVTIYFSPGSSGPHLQVQTLSIQAAAS